MTGGKLKVCQERAATVLVVVMTFALNVLGNGTKMANA
jgi:hypothetical protein